ncbi:MAG: Crp/Fnr family transcriptional regulator [Saprospiraceae bacterium]|nr:Crp/Fnr family transcriptional regulator [Saprospiraceae bacterium]
MNRFAFSTFLTSNTDLDQELIDGLVGQCTRREVTRGAYLLREGETCEHSFFVEKGLLKQFAIDHQGKEHILQFAPENWIVSDRASAYFHQPSEYYIQALEDTQVMLVDEAFILQLARNNASFLEFNHRLLHNHIRHLQQRILQLQSATASERYQHFVKIYPDLLLRIPQVLIASYLGITPESLSRVRRDLAEQNRTILS